MGPSEEQFHAADGSVPRAYSTRELALRGLQQRTNAPALPSPGDQHINASWIKNVLGGVFARRATA